MAAWAQSVGHGKQRGKLLLYVLQDVLTEQEVNLAGTVAQRWGVGQRVACDSDPRVTSIGACQGLCAWWLRLDEQQPRHPVIGKKPFAERTDACPDLDDLTADEPRRLLKHPIAQSASSP